MTDTPITDTAASQDEAPQSATTPDTDSEQKPAPEVDWKAKAREWEKRAKENKHAASELEKLKTAQMSEQEKAVAEAKAAGAAETAQSYGTKLAAAELRAAAAAKGVDLTALGDLIDTSRFLGEDGEIDRDAITTTVETLSQSLGTRGPKRSGGDFSGGNGAGHITREQLTQMSPADIEQALAEGKLSHLM